MINYFRALFREIMILLPGLLFWGGIVAYIIYRANHPVKRSKLEKSILRVIGFAFAGAVCVGGVIVFSAMWGTVAKTKLNVANGNAKMVFKVYLSALTELDMHGKLPEHSDEFIMGAPDETYEPDTLGYYIDKYFNDHEYYVIVTDGNWHVEYTLWSRKPITPDEIRHYTRDSQYALFKSPFSDQNEIVGYYETTEKERQFGNITPSEVETS